MAILRDPPPRLNSSGRGSKFDEDVQFAKDHPGQWCEIEGSHSSGSAPTLKRKGVKVRTVTITEGPEKGQVTFFIMYDPDDQVEPEPAKRPGRKPKQPTIVDEADLPPDPGDEPEPPILEDIELPDLPEDEFRLHPGVTEDLIETYPEDHE